MKKSCILIFLCLLSCTNKPKANQSTSRLKEVPPKQISQDSNTAKLPEAVKEDSLINVVKTPKLKLDYSLKASEVETLQDSASYLAHYFNQFEKTNDSISEILFFNMFPNNSKDFMKLYGYSKDKELISTLPMHEKPSNLYGSIYKFYEPSYVLKKEYVKKLIAISIDTRWEADNVGILRHKLNKIVPSNFELSNEVLNHKTSKEIKSFWIFYFDGPHPEQASKIKQYNEIIAHLKDKDPDMIPLVEQAYTFVKEEWGNHGH